MALRDEIRAFTQSAQNPVLAVPTPELPQWDGQIYVTRVSPRALEAFWKGSEEDETTDERARFVVLTASDSSGSRIFQEEDVLWLTTCAVLQPMIERLYWAGRHHNGLTEENRKTWQKNLPGTAGGGSPSCCAAPAPPATD